MGDVIHTLPALRALRRSFPDSTIGWVVEDNHAEVLSGLPEIDRLYILPRKRLKSGWRSRFRLAGEMKTRMREVRWDVAIDFQGLWKSLMVARWSGARRRLGYAPSHEKRIGFTPTGSDFRPWTVMRWTVIWIWSHPWGLRSTERNQGGISSGISPFPLPHPTGTMRRRF